MFSWLRDWWEWEKLQRLREKTRAEHRRQAREYENDKSKTREDVMVLASEQYYEGKSIDEAVNIFLSDRLLGQAARYDIEIPQGQDSWEYSENANRNYLTAQARAVLREKIAPARARQLDDRARVLAFVAAITGLIGTITGLVAVIHNKK